MKFKIAAFSIAAIVVVAITGFHSTQSQTKKAVTDSTLSDSERDLLSEINLARAHPLTYASYLEKLRPMFDGKRYKESSGNSFTTEEGWSAVDDAIAFLRAAKPSGTMRISRGVCLDVIALVREKR